MGKAKWVVGTDIGGTFTDVIGVNLETGEQRIGKVPSTPPTFFEGVINGLKRAVPVSESISLPSSPSLKAVMRPAQPMRRKGKILPDGDSTSPASGAGCTMPIRRSPASA